MTEDLEFQISQYADGTLSEAQRIALEEILARDESARALLEEYRRLDGAIRAGITPLADIQWGALHRHISDYVAAESEPAQSYKIDAARSARWMGPRRMALAASLLIVCGVAIALLRDNGAGHVGVSQQPVTVSVVNGPAIEAPAGTPNAEITLTPPASADASAMYPYAEGVVYQPSHVTIASAAGIGKGVH